MSWFRRKKLSDEDLTYMSSLSQAALEKPTFKSQLMVWVILLVIVWGIVWAQMATLDKIVRAEGKVVPSSNLQVLQNLEGGIVEAIYVHEGDKVHKGQLLLKLDNTLYVSSFGESQIKEYGLKAKAARLEAQATGKPLHFQIPDDVKDNPVVVEIFTREKALYEAKIKELETTKAIYDHQIEQSELELKEAKSQLNQLWRTHAILKKRVDLLKPLVKRGIASREDLLKLEQELNEAVSKIKTIKNSIPSLESKIKEVEKKKQQAIEEFRNKAYEELNEVLTEIAQIEKSKTALADRVRRTEVRSPVSGTIKRLLVTTIGGVVQPGSDMIEIVPDDDRLIVEAKVLPADIGFVRPGLKANLKFTAYDFAIYGGLEGTVEQVSADSITDEEGNSYFIVKVKTDRNYLGTPDKPLRLMPGMVATVDIVVGKHTVLDYLLKPIIKAKETALRES
jgi:adhesin transport system membrane fusion protein